MKKILVTGGAGYIGSHTCKLLSRLNYEPIVYDNLSNGNKSFVKWGPLVEGDIRDTNLLESTLKYYRPDSVVHFAGLAYVNESILKPEKYYSNNVSGTISLAEAMIKSNIKKIVFSSTCAVYGLNRNKLISENTNQNPINPYGSSKKIVEKVLTDLEKIKKINFVSLRYFNASGADKELEIGELHDPETHLIPLAIMSSKKKNQILKVFGTDFNTPDGTAIRDYIHVEDLALGHVAALSFLEENDSSDFINLGSGKGTSVLEIINKLAKLGVKPNFINDNRREGDPESLVADISKAKRLLNWRPKFSDIDKILESAILWHNKK